MAFSLLSITEERSDIHLHYYALGDTERSFKGQVKGTRPEQEQCLADVVTEHLVSAIFFLKLSSPSPLPATLAVITERLPKNLRL